MKVNEGVGTNKGHRGGGGGWSESGAVAPGGTGLGETGALHGAARGPAWGRGGDFPP